MLAHHQNNQVLRHGRQKQQLYSQRFVEQGCVYMYSLGLGNIPSMNIIIILMRHAAIPKIQYDVRTIDQLHACESTHGMYDVIRLLFYSM